MTGRKNGVFQGRETSLTAATTGLRGTDYRVKPAPSWTYKGCVLTEISITRHTERWSNGHKQQYRRAENRQGEEDVMATAEQMAERMALELKRMCEAKDHQTVVMMTLGGGREQLTQVHALQLLEQAGLATEEGTGKHPVYRPTMAGYQAKEAHEKAETAGKWKEAIKEWGEAIGPTSEVAARVIDVAQKVLSLQG